MPAPAARAIPVKGPDGSIYEVPPSEMANLPEGATVASEKDVSQARAEAKYGGLGGQAVSGALGAARELSFGGSDIAATSIADALGGASARKQTAEYLREHEEANPVATALGEYGSAIIPGLGEVGLAGKTGRVAEALSAPTRAIFGAGRIAENLAGNLIGREAEGTLARAAQAGVRKAAGAAVEGAAFGVGGELSDSAIQDHELTAEKLLAAAGKGSLLGGALGAGMGAGGELLGSAAKGLGESVLRAAKETSIADYLDKVSGGAVWHGVGGGNNKKLTKLADKRFEGGYQELGRTLRDEAKDLLGENISHKNQGRLAEKIIERDGKIIGESLNTLDEAAARVGESPRAIDFVDDLRASAQKAESTWGQKSIANKINELADHLAEVTGIAPGMVNYAQAANQTISFQELHRLKQRLGKMASFNSVEVPEMKQALQSLYGDVQGRIKSSMDEIAAKAGEQSVRDAYEKANKGFQAAKFLEDATKERTAKSGGNLALTLSSKIASAAGSVAGSFLGGAAGGIAGGALGLVGGNLARSHGDFAAAEVLHRLSKLAAVEKASLQIDNRITNSVSSFVHGTRGEFVTRNIKEDPKSYARQAQEITALANNPPAMMAKIEHGIGNLGPQAPGMTKMLAQKAANDYAFLASKAPKARLSTTTLTPQFEKPHMSHIEAMKFGRYVRGVRDPLSLLDELKQGNVSRETVEAVQATSPKLYAQIRENVIDECAKLGSKLSYDKRLQLGILFHAPTDETLRPDVMAMLQQSATTPGATTAENEPSGKPGSRPIKSDASVYKTDAQKVEGSA